MAEEIWHRPEDVAALLGVKPDSVVKRARRHESGGDDAEQWVRRVQAKAEGGKARVEIHSSLIARWLGDSTKGTALGANRSDSLVWQEMQRAKQGETDLTARLQAAELAHRDEQISQLSATVMSKELEIARLKRELATVGQMVATLTSDA